MLQKKKLMGPIMQELQTDPIIWLKNHGKTLSTAEYLMGCTVQFLPVQGNCWVPHSCISHTKPIKILPLAAGPLEAQLFPIEAFQTRLFLHWETKWAALGTDGTMPYKMASCTETRKADSPLTAITQALLISCLWLKNVKPNAGCQTGQK